MQLNPQQEQAATILAGPVLVLAGAGAGKTKTLTTRIIRLIESGVMPQNILAITFTNKAASEMKDRIHAAIKENPKFTFPVFEQGFVPWVGTFHALGVYILRQQHQKVGLHKYFTIYDRDDSRRAVKEAVKQADLDPKQWDTKKVLGFISRNKGNFVSLDDFKSGAEDSYFVDNMIDIWTKYEAIKTADHALDFDDLLLTTAKLLESDETVRAGYQRQWQHVHIDEYQDTNRVQYTLAKLLVNPDSRNIFVVGDPDQLIYSWRGAEISNIMKFEKDYPGAQTVLLEQNYRSTGTIIEGSNRVIEKNQNRFPKNLFTEKDGGEKISLYSAYDAREEADWLGQEIKKLIDTSNPGSRASRVRRPSDIAVLYRANFQSRLLEEVCLRYNIPYQVLGTKFFDRQEVRDVMAYIRAALNPDALIDVRRVINTPRRGIGKVSLAKIFAGNESALTGKTQDALSSFRATLTAISRYSQEHTPAELVSFVITESGMERMYQDSSKEEDLERLANMYELAAVASKYDQLAQGEALEKFIEDVALASDQDSRDDNQDTVKLMTIHAAKGLEFDTVFLTGAEESLFSPNPDEDQKKVEEKGEEERRLFYVAMTRAKEKLYLSWANVRDVFGSSEVNLLSSFVLDIPPELVAEEESLAFGAYGKRDFGDDDDEEVVYLDW